MLPAITFPLHDKTGEFVGHLEIIDGFIKTHFSKCYVSITPATQNNIPDKLEKLKQDSFYFLCFNDENSQVGDHFMTGYREAAKQSANDLMIHLSTLDRFIFAVKNYEKQLVTDINSAQSTTLFTRSDYAWSTHPINYYAAEKSLTTVGEILFGKTLDFGWCHLVVSSKRLTEVFQNVVTHDLTILAEIILQLKNELNIQQVNWLAWEDPFIEGKDLEKLKTEREHSHDEVSKRLSYVIPILEYLLKQGQ